MRERTFYEQLDEALETGELGVILKQNNPSNTEKLSRWRASRGVAARGINSFGVFLVVFVKPIIKAIESENKGEKR